MISVYLDTEMLIMGLCADDLSGCTDWLSVDERRLGLDMYSPLHDERGVALYRLVDGVAVERTPEERQTDRMGESAELETPDEADIAAALMDEIMEILTGEI